MWKMDKILEKYGVKKDKKSKKKKTSKKFTGSGLKVIDSGDEMTVSYGSRPALKNVDNDDADDLMDEDELPVIANVVDERPLEVQLLEQFKKTNKWKTITDDLSDQQKRDSPVTNNMRDQHVSGKKRNYDSDASPPRRKRSPGGSPVKIKKLDKDKSRRRQRDSDSDVSPPRKSRRDDRDASPPRKCRRENSDASPPRRRRDNSDISPPRKRRDNTDMSPPRKSRRDNSDVSPPRKSRRGDLDHSPPRKSRRDVTPPRRKIVNRDDSDVSPPRKSQKDRRSSPRRGRADRGDSDPSPPRNRREPSPRGRRHDDSDASPPRRKRTDLGSPLRRKRRDSDASPPRRKRRDSDASPPRRPRKDDSDASPPRRKRKENSDSDASPPRRPAKRSSRSPSTEKTLEGKRAGLQAAGSMRSELERIRIQEQETFSQMDDDVTGRYAKTRYRDKETGLLRDFGAEKAKKDEEDKKAAERKAQYDRWGKGLKQIEQQEERLQSAVHEMSKPLARYEDDTDLDAHLKSIEREGDPMLKFLAKKKSKASGPAKPMYRGPPPPPNRFGIMPGYRWDGVDRSNGYEKQWFERINSKKALQEESYKWSVEDL